MNFLMRSWSSILSLFKPMASLRKLFPNSEIFENSKITEASPLKFSYFIPSLKLAFDYQKDSYYGITASSGNYFLKLKQSDDKLNLVGNENVTLCSILNSLLVGHLQLKRSHYLKNKIKKSKI